MIGMRWAIRIYLAIFLIYLLFPLVYMLLIAFNDSRIPTHRDFTFTLLWFGEAWADQRLWQGHFEIWADDGEVVFRHAMGLFGAERPTPGQTAAMIDVAMEAADRFYPAFDFLLAGAKTPEEAMAACMFETVGRA